MSLLFDFLKSCMLETWWATSDGANFNFSFTTEWSLTRNDSSCPKHSFIMTTIYSTYNVIWYLKNCIELPFIVPLHSSIASIKSSYKYVVNGYKFISTESLAASSKYWRVRRRTHKCPTSATKSNSTRGFPTCPGTSSTMAIYTPVGVFSHFSTFATAHRNRCGRRVLESSCTGDLPEQPRSRATPVPKTPPVFRWTDVQWEGTSSQKPSSSHLSLHYT